MSFNNSFTAVTGATYTAAQYNTHVRDNLTAIWVYTTAGDIVYATGAATLARLGIGPANTVLGSNGSIPGWTHSPAIAGVLHASGLADFNPDTQTFNSSTWTDITGATLNLVLSATCTIMVLAHVVGYNNAGASGRNFFVRASVDGNTDTNHNYAANGSDTVARNEALPYLYRIASIAAGTKTVKLQCRNDTNANIVTRGRLIAMAFLE